MTFSFQVINDLNELKDYKDKDWKTVFEKPNQSVDDKGGIVSGFYQGRTYTLYGQYERGIPLLERVVRVTLGIFALLLTLGFAAFSQTIRNLLLKSKQVVRVGIEPKESAPGRTVEGIKTSEIASLSIEEFLGNVNLSGTDIPVKVYKCFYAKSNGKTGHTNLNQIQIRDHRDWLKNITVPNDDFSDFAVSMVK